MRVVFSLVLFVGLLSACSSLPKKQCASLHWDQIGRDDVWSGGYTARFREGVNLCHQEGKLADIEAYQRGKNEALLAFCTSENGYDWGRSGRPHLNVCPPALSTAFQNSYQSGLRQFQSDVASTRATKDYSYERLANEHTDNVIKAENEKRERVKNNSAGGMPFLPSVTSNGGGPVYETHKLPSVFDER